jgi:hypothetical protein
MAGIYGGVQIPIKKYNTGELRRLAKSKGVNIKSNGKNRTAVALLNDLFKKGVVSQEFVRLQSLNKNKLIDELEKFGYTDLEKKNVKQLVQLRGVAKNQIAHITKVIKLLPYDKIFKLVYTNDPDGELIVAPIVLRDIIHRDNSLRGKIKVVLVYSYTDINGNRIKDYEKEETYTIPNNVFRWWNKKHIYRDWMVDSDNNKFQMIYYRLEKAGVNPDTIKVKLVFMKPNKIEADIIAQKYAVGITNCVLNPIMSWVNEKIEDSATNETKRRYENMKKKVESYSKIYNNENGIPEDKLHEISNSLKLKFELCDVFNNSYLTIEPEQKPLRTFKYINTKMDHVDLVTSNDNNDTVLTNDEMKKKCIELNEKGIFYNYYGDYLCPYKLTTLDGSFKLTNDFAETVKVFNESIKLSDVRMNTLENKELSKFVRYGSHYTGCLDYKDNIRTFENVKHIDHIKSYTQFKNCKFYRGFPSLFTDFRKIDINKLEYENFLNKYIGYYLIENINLNKCNDKIKIHLEALKYLKGKIIFPSPELLFYLSLGCEFNIVSGAYCVQPYYFEFDESMLKKEKVSKEINGEIKIMEGASYYALWTGRLFSHDDKQNIKCRISKQLAQTLKLKSGKKNGNIIYWEPINECEVEYDKDKIIHYSHIHGFLTSYSRIQVLTQIFKMDTDKVLRINTDGIYYIDHEFEIDPLFRQKDGNIKNNVAAMELIKSKLEPNPLDCCDDVIKEANNWDDDLIYNSLDDNINDTINKLPEFRQLDKYVVVMGPGGSNKTGSNLKDKGLLKLLFVAPSWKLATNKYNEYKIKSNVVARLIGNNCEPEFKYKFPSNIIIDEGTQLNMDVKFKVQELYPYSRVLFVGDWNDNYDPYQCPCIKGIPLNFKDDNFQTIKMTKIFRTKCPKLLLICKMLRDYMDKDLSHIDNKYDNKITGKALLNMFELLNMKDHIIKKKDVYDSYSEKDFILANTHKYVNHWTDAFVGQFEKEQYLIKKNSKDFKNGDVIWAEEKPSSAEIRYAFTVHQFQGETVKEGHKLFIDLRYSFLPQMIYTAISRAESIEQIYLVDK